MAVMLLPLLVASSMVVIPAPLPDRGLLEGLRGRDYETGEGIIRTRLERRFPIGGSDSTLAGYLRSEGFTVDRIETSGAPDLPIYGSASIKGGRGCAQIVHVEWRGDRFGRIRTLLVNYTATGCL